MALRIHGQRALKTLPGLATRPTPARVREAIFNIWQGRIEGCRWLDICSGSGAMGAEALCRGAKIVMAIDQSPRACQVIRANWQGLCGPEQEIQIIRGDVRHSLSRLDEKTVDFIYFDPPYDSDLYQPVITEIFQGNFLAPGGEMAVECRTGQVPTMEAMTDRYHFHCRQKSYGSTTLLLLQKM
ncbi:16S rRNA (guanine(966)-N(2))-methyltransferase RsmD [Candidatus Synechococcus calcipolaris G9]|uniref:16S rRNA (Guanine(966)-N(2))-methyltransferase RsmD n=1 Tax=Candidatus Synechococcus calcipolaris G9 TaxID=1497997 RepID=A0ABT6EXC2_9SYNE|nr:16S rRNA (guanine(966)-N(2))-methyltransferase RsmD [Candidatus Synechococcus calcipolaris]MDG2990392.1 16S rRNA (guanine(966)-N(2))-methyltransferase RsmD [Candidatus Synechococcus calcipolaris G9]